MMPSSRYSCCVYLLIGALLTLDQSAAAKTAKGESTEKHVIGATADFLEEASGLRFAARVDTGAATCSVHAEKIEVEDASKKMTKNVGKKISFDLIDPDGERKRVESTIADTVRVKTSDKDRWERRYKVWMTLRHNGVSRRVHVTLNNREHMQYRLLIGRNYLCGRFLVDVSTKHSPQTEEAEGSAPEKQARAEDASPPDDPEEQTPAAAEEPAA